MAGASAQREMADRLLALGASTLHESVGPHGRRGAMDSDIRPLEPHFRVSGPAATVACHPADNLAIHRALKVVEPGRVLVVETGKCMAGYWGEILTATAASREVAGLVIDGAVRDAAEIAARGFPVFTRGVSMLGTSKASPGVLFEPIVCGGAIVRDGDWVVGDRDGVVVLPVEDIDGIMQRAHERMEREHAMLAALDAGAGRAP